MEKSCICNRSMKFYDSSNLDLPPRHFHPRTNLLESNAENGKRVNKNQNFARVGVDRVWKRWRP